MGSATRTAELAAFPKDEVVADVGHTQRLVSVPTLLRPCSMHHGDVLDPAPFFRHEVLRLMQRAGPASPVTGSARNTCRG